MSTRRGVRPPTPLHVPKELEASILAQLRRIEGQIGGLQRMLTAGRDCAEVAQQLGAARAALDRVAMDLLAAGLEQCVRRQLDGAPEAAEALGKLRKVFLTLR